MSTVLIWFTAAALVAIVIVKGLYVLSVILAIPGTGGAMFCTTHPSKIETVLDNLPMKKGEVLIDLGCGDGRFLAAAAKRYGIRGTGYEINILAWFLATMRLFFSARQVCVVRESFWDVDFSNADYIFCYLFPDLMERLSEKAEREMKSGAVLISCNFELPGCRPDRILKADHSTQKDPVYIYVKG